MSCYKLHIEVLCIEIQIDRSTINAWTEGSTEGWIAEWMEGEKE